MVNTPVSECIEEGSSITIERRFLCRRGEVESGDTECVFFVNAPRHSGPGSVLDVSPGEFNLVPGGHDVELTITANSLPDGNPVPHSLQRTLENCNRSQCNPSLLNATFVVKSSCP